LLCRHVILPTDIARFVPKNKLLTEAEWRALGVAQSKGWDHYAVHKPEPHILLFRRALSESPNPPPGSVKNPSPAILEQWRLQQQLEAQP
jgi:cyclin-dependent kinase regulatory subunit CKS1